MHEVGWIRCIQSGGGRARRPPPSEMILFTAGDVNEPSSTDDGDSRAAAMAEFCRTRRGRARVVLISANALHPGRFSSGRWARRAASASSVRVSFAFGRLRFPRNACRPGARSSGLYTDRYKCRRTLHSAVPHVHRVSAALRIVAK